MSRGGQNKTHGMSKTREYHIWHHIVDRCHNPDDAAFADYGEKGRVVCADWQTSFPAFIEAMGLRPSSKHSVERINNDLGYTCGKCQQCQENGWPMNCRWATQREQMQNTRRSRIYTFEGKTLCLAEWARQTGLGYALLRTRLVYLKWGIERALTTPARSSLPPRAVVRKGRRKVQGTEFEPVKRGNRFIDITGKRIGRLVVLECVGKRNGKVYWRCRCDCGGTIIVSGSNLATEHTQSCDCLMAENTKKANTRHGWFGTTEYTAWQCAKDRCFNPNEPAFDRYGGADPPIVMCPLYKGSFEEFIADLGAKPEKGLTLDRIESSRGYTCGRCPVCRERGDTMNCRWATRQVQQWNRRVTRMLPFQGEELPASEWAKRTGISAATILVRIDKLGWTIEEALTTPVHHRPDFVYASHTRPADSPS